MNHKEAFEYLLENPSLDAIAEIQQRLTNDHEIPELADTPHFLPQQFRGVIREHKEGYERPRQIKGPG